METVSPAQQLPRPEAPHSVAEAGAQLVPAALPQARGWLRNQGVTQSGPGERGSGLYVVVGRECLFCQVREGVRPEERTLGGEAEKASVPGDSCLVLDPAVPEVSLALSCLRHEVCPAGVVNAKQVFARICKGKCPR